MLLNDVVEVSDTIRATRSRLAKTASIADLLARAETGQVPLLVAYLSGRLPQGKVGVGYSLVYDIGPAPAPNPSLLLAAVDDQFTRLAGISGTGSQARRRALLTDLMEAATAPEQAFLRALILGELRQGASTGVMEEAIARAADVPVGLVRRAAMVSGDLAAVGRVALADGSDGLGSHRLEILSPLQPMLAQSAAHVAAALEKTGPAAVEYKIDGARIQVHRAADEVRVFTRNLRDITGSMPEVVEAILDLDVASLILDGEAIALSDTGRPRPFQVTMSRIGSRQEAGALRADTPLTPFIFDCLHLNGRDLIDEPTSERIAALGEALPSTLLIPRVETTHPEEAQAFFNDALAAGQEGVVVKSLAAPYEAGRRGAGWVKVKPVHTLDLVILAAEWGSGRRHGWLSNLHLGARDPSGGFVMLGKTFKGLTDEVLTWQTERFLDLETHREGDVVFVRPVQVVEIAFDGVQRSSRYPGGVALRFARVKGYRHDKTAAEADTVESVRGFLSE